MGSVSDYAELKILELIVGKTAFSTPTVYIALCTADPTDAGTGASMNEVTNANAYARKSTAGADWNAAASGAISNANAIGFVEASGSWGTISHFVLVDSGTHGAGNVLAHGSLGVSKAISNGDAVTFGAGDLSATLD